MTTLDTLNFEALYVPGMRFWRPTVDRRQSIVAQNANGAVEIWHAAKDPTVGGVLAHLPTSREGYDHAADCAVLLGGCHTRESAIAYRYDFLPLLQAEDVRAVLQQLADWHDAVCRTVVAA